MISFRNHSDTRIEIQAVFMSAKLTKHISGESDHFPESPTKNIPTGLYTLKLIPVNQRPLK